MRFAICATIAATSSLMAAGDIPFDVIAPAYHGEVPWFTGPLLTSSGNNIPEGHINFEPFVFATYSDSSYDSDWKSVANAYSSWDINLAAIFQAGLTTWLDFTFTPTWFLDISNGSTTFSLGDCSAAFGFQILRQPLNGWYPSIRIVIGETFPTGRFENLDPEQFGTDLVGAGSYTTTALLALSWRIHLWHIHWAYIRLGASYTIPAKVRVHGYSAFGGAYDTNGWIYPGNGYQFFYGCEFSINQNWVLALDVVANFNDPVRFKGFPGFIEETGLPADLTVGSSAQFSLAPAIEYNWSANLGLISGVWFTFAGRNAQAFTSWVTAVNYFY